MPRKTSGSKTKVNGSLNKKTTSRLGQLPFGVKMVLFASLVLLITALGTYGFTKWETSKKESTLRASANQWTLIQNNPSSVSVYACNKERTSDYMYLRLLFVRNKLYETDATGKQQAWLPTTKMEIVDDRNNVSAEKATGEQLAWYQTVSMMAAYIPPKGGFKTNFNNNYESPEKLQACPNGVN